MKNIIPFIIVIAGFVSLCLLAVEQMPPAKCEIENRC